MTPGYPGFEIEVEGLRENPDLIANLTVNETVDHLAEAVQQVESPPIIMGHSFGGTLTQLLLAPGLGAAGVVVDRPRPRAYGSSRSPRHARSSPR